MSEEVGVRREFGEGFTGEGEGLWLGLCCSHFEVRGQGALLEGGL